MSLRRQALASLSQSLSTPSALDSLGPRVYMSKVRRTTALYLSAYCTYLYLTTSFTLLYYSLYFMQV